MQPQRPPFWEWPLDRLNVLLLTGALIVLLLLSVFNFAIQRRASDLALATPTPLGPPVPPVVQTVITIAPPAAPETTPAVTRTITPTTPADVTPLAIVTPRHGSRFPTPLAHVAGTAPAGATVQVFDNNRRLGQTVAGADGTWALDLSIPLAEGDHLLRAQASDAQQRPLGRSAPVLVTILAPEPPKVLAPTASTRLNARSAPTISGSAMPDSRIRVLVDQQTLGEANSNASGAWQLKLTKPLARGQHRLRADLISPNGNVLVSSAEVMITVAP